MPSYSSSLKHYLTDRGEGGLRLAYELGRRAVSEHFSVMDLARIHHDVLLSALKDLPPNGDVKGLIDAGGDFFIESLSAFEMIGRGFHEAEARALLEKRNAAILGQLSKLLFDIVAVDSMAALEESCRIVAEQAREITSAEYCFLSAVVEADKRRVIKASSVAKPSENVAALVETQLSAIELDIGTLGANRIHQAGRGRHPTAWPQHDRESELIRGWATAPLTGSKGEVVGHLHVLNKRDGNFSDLDEAILLQLANLTSAAIEKVESREQERRAALTFYHRLLPARLPDVRGIDTAARLFTGEDTVTPRSWYDMFRLDTRRVAAVVGEVEASEIGTAATIAQLRAILRSVSVGDDPPEAVIDQADRLVQDLDQEHSSTMTFVSIDISEGVAHIVRAGHSAPIVIDPNGTSRQVDSKPGVALGALSSPRHESVRLSLTPGSTLLLRSDHLIADLEAISFAVRNGASVIENRAEKICETLLEHLPKTDDRPGALLVLKY
ncbi:MAG TPA: SpoIIE family protein phosphatase, partial [Actinomycetota bacterium]|nr:SpoIIE family protein phosphatase [Actinomycetota bacterium]